MPVLNAFYGNKKIAIVGDSQTAKDIEEALKAENFKNVISFEAPSSYAAYYGISEEEPDYTLFVEETAQCKVKLTRVQGLLGDRLGHEVKRDYEESRKAQGFYEHHLKKIRIYPSLLGAVEIPLKEVKDIPWFYQNSSPMLHLFVPKAEGVAQAVVEAIKDYFKR